MKTKFGKIKRKIAIITIFFMMLTMYLPLGTFAADIEGISDHWSKVTIQNWLDKGYISGYPDGSFRLDNNVTRAEFITLANKAFGYTATASVTYSDVKADAWYASAISIAKAAGYISGYPDGTMRPENSISREEVASIIMKIKGLAADPTAANIFTDSSKMIWGKGAVGAVANAKIMNGYPDKSFAFQALIKRGESVVALDHADKYVAVPVIPAAPAAPVVTSNDDTNTVTGMLATMEYKLDSNDWVTYVANVFNGLNFSGDHTLLVRYAADGNIPFSAPTTLTFTTNIIYGGGSSTIPVSAISVTGNAVVGSTLTAAPIPSGATGSYQWQVADAGDGTYANILGATSSAYVIDGAYAGKFIKVTFIASGSYIGTLSSNIINPAVVMTGSIKYWTGVGSSDVTTGTQTEAIGAGNVISITKDATKNIRIALADGVAVSGAVVAETNGTIADGTSNYSTDNAKLVPLYLTSVPAGAEAYYTVKNGGPGADAYSKYLLASINISGTKTNMNIVRDFSVATDTTGKQLPYAYLYQDSTGKLWLVDGAKNSIAGTTRTLNQNRYTVDSLSESNGEPAGDYVMAGALYIGNIGITLRLAN